MWLSLNIISDMVDIKDINPEEIAAKLTMSTAEIEGIEYMNHHLKTVVSARILDVTPHPNADKLTLVELDSGKEKYKVVCGAPNHKKGDIVPLATEGTKFTEEFTVKKTKIRGVESCGMLCSEKELGFSDDHSGIMIMPEDTPLGVPLSDIYPNRIDTRLEIDNKSITHRPDLWCHAGFAREIAALFGKKFKNIIDLSLADGFKNIEKLNVTIKNPDASPRYCGLYIKNIKIAESPEWLKARVTSIGMRPINNIVDITNYVMAEVGEPMHAFDRKKLRGDTIFVRMADNGEILKTLDDQVHTLTSDDIVIADKDGSIALAGVMGGGGSEIDDSTNEIVLEAANFNPINIRKTANRYNLRTEAAIRFEKSLDPEVCQQAILRCYDLIKQLIPEAEAVTGIIDTYPKKSKKTFIKTNSDFIRKKLGANLDDKKITSILESLSFNITKDGDNLSIEVPSYRATKDISIPDDIAEEIGRIYGYDNIPPVPPFVPCTPPERNEKRLFERRIKEILSRDSRMAEVSNYSFIGEDILNKLKINNDKELRLKNPLSQEHDRLRCSLVPNIIKNIELNQRHTEYFRIFELGRAYFKNDRKSKDLAQENTRITGAVFDKNPAGPLFYEAKNIVLNLIEQLNIMNVKYDVKVEGLPPYAHPGRAMSVRVDNKNAIQIYELHPKTAKDLDIKGSAAIFDIDMDVLFSAKKKEKIFIELPKYPDVPFEVSVLAEKNVYAADICSIIRNASRDFIKSVDIITIYEGSPIPEGMKSVSIKIIFAAKDKTLSAEEIDGLQKKVISDINSKGYKLR